MPQFYPGVARSDPRQGLLAGARTMQSYLSTWDGDVRRALASYNAGLGRVQALVATHGDGWEAKLPLETRQYLGAILGVARPRIAVTPGAAGPLGAVGASGGVGMPTPPRWHRPRARAQRPRRRPPASVGTRPRRAHRRWVLRSAFARHVFAGARWWVWPSG